MIKIAFIAIGLCFIIYAAWQFLFTNKSTANESDVIDISQCDYCGDYVEIKPEFKNDVCSICSRKRIKHK